MHFVFVSLPLQAALYYRLLGDYVGQGDKETFALAMWALGSRYASMLKTVIIILILLLCARMY